MNFQLPTDSHQPLAPAWSNYPLPFMVIVRNTSFLIEPAPPQASSSRSRSRSQTRNSPSNAQPPHLSSSPIHSEIYPEIRYVFSDDDFAPTIDVLDAQQLPDSSAPPHVSLILDFDPSGTRIVNATSLSSAWQISRVSERSSSSPSTHPSLASHHPSWAPTAAADTSTADLDSVAHVLFVDGTSARPLFRTAPPLPPNVHNDAPPSQGLADSPHSTPGTNFASVASISSSSGSLVSGGAAPTKLRDDEGDDSPSHANTQQPPLETPEITQMTVRALTEQFLERNRQLREIINSMASHT